MHRPLKSEPAKRNMWVNTLDVYIVSRNEYLACRSEIHSQVRVPCSMLILTYANLFLLLASPDCCVRCGSARFIHARPKVVNLSHKAYC